MIEQADGAIFTRAEVLEFRLSGGHAPRRISSITVRHSGEIMELSAGSFVIAAGTIDSNLLVLRSSMELGFYDNQTIGSRLHDHLVVPLAEVDLPRDRRNRDLLVPRFRDGMIVTNRFEISCNTGWRATGFIRLTADFKKLAPYRQMLRFLRLKYKGASVSELVRAVQPLLRAAPQIARAGFERAVSGQVFLEKGCCLTAQLEFESFPHELNRLEPESGGAALHWDIHSEDERNFVGLARISRDVINQLAVDHGVRPRFIFDVESRSAAVNHLQLHGTDASHLGGGLSLAPGSSGAVDSKLRLQGTENGYVISSAVFARPGIVNPTATLLALADRFAKQA